jgi:hypothetical protein
MELLTHTPILRLPSKEVQQRGKRLSHQTKANPEDHITRNFPLNPLDLLYDVCEGNEWNLEHHTRKRNADDVVRRHTNK